ncbi:MAG: hypothetical protein DRN27_05020 [Thermoplasmata archaeon]|nr:MAG: hypothetical protein DRN27_05020 [Thermoplasmata archaeon]
MVGEAEKEENTQKTVFDIESELHSLVEKRMIPHQIANKLLARLLEKNISLSKDQFYTLVDKINQVILTYKKNNKIPEEIGNKTEDTQESENNTLPDEGTIADIHLLFEKIDNLQVQFEQLKEEKQTSVHSETINHEDSIISTEDIISSNSNVLSTHAISTDPLTSVPNNPESIIVLMNWLQYLIDQCGYKNLDAILEYYVDINWITDDVKMGLLDYSNGIKKEKKASNTKDGSKVEHTILPSKDHIQSYMFIQKLKGKKFDKHFVDRIQNDLIRLRKKVDKYQQFQSE